MTEAQKNAIKKMMIPGSDNFWEKVKGLIPEEDEMHYIGEGSPRRAMPNGAPVIGQPRKGARAKALTWDDIRAMNDAYLKDIEKKNMQIKPDEKIEDLLKQVQTYKNAGEQPNSKKGRYSERYKNAVQKIQDKKKIQEAGSQPDTQKPKMTAEEFEKYLNENVYKKSPRTIITSETIGLSSRDIE